MNKFPLFKEVSLFLLIVFFDTELTFCQKSIPFSDIRADSLHWEIAKWRNFKTAALTITFDDGIRSQFTTAVPMLNERSLKGSFYIVTNYVGKGFTPDWDTLNKVALEGHEIGSHSRNHANIANLASNAIFKDSLKRELLESRDVINRHIPCQKCETFCWPGGAVSPQAIFAAKKYYLSCRASGKLLNYGSVQDFYNVQSMPIYHNTPLATINTWVDQIIQLKGWMIERIHGINTGIDSTGYEPVPVNVLKNHWDHIVQRQNQLWVATFNEVTKYIRERDNTGLKIADYQQGILRLSFSNKLDDSAYRLPLTVRIKLTGKLTYFNGIQQNGKPIDYEKLKKDSINYLVFDAIPNKGNIVINIPVEYVESHPDPYSSTTIISFDLTSEQRIKLTIFNPGGTVVKRYKGKFPSGANSIKFDGSKRAVGKYSFSLEIGKGFIYWSNLTIAKDNIVAQKR